MYIYILYIHTFSGRRFKSNSGQLSIATSKNPSVLYTICIIHSAAFM